jgi:hypothetical protein
VKEPKPNSCRVVDGEGDSIEYIWTLADGRGILHDHAPDGCPFEPGGPYAGQAEELADGFAGEPCPACGQVHG